MLQKICPKCLNHDPRTKKAVNLFNLVFEESSITKAMSEVLPNNKKTAGTFCISTGCDPKYQILCDETRALPNKQTFKDRNQAN